MPCDKEKMMQWLEAGIRAPSADNLQPWKFLISEPASGEAQVSKIELLIDETRVHAFCDQGLLTPYLSAGAVIENLRVAAASDGYEIISDYFPQPENVSHVATLRFKEATASGHPHSQAVGDRSTNRRLYDPRYRIDAKVLERLEAVVTRFESSPQKDSGFKMYWMDRENPSYGRHAKILAEADRLRFEIPRLHRELFSITRFSKSEVQSQSDGLDIKTLETGLAGEWMFRLIGSWPRLQFLNKIGISKVLGDYTRKQMLSSSGALLITAPSRKPDDFVRGGELMERIWHECTRQGLALQPMEGLPIFILNLRLNELDDLTDHQKRDIKRLTEALYATCSLDASEEIIMLFRLGRAKAPSASSVRRPVQSFILRQNEKVSRY